MPTLKKRGDATKLHLQPGGELDYEQDGLIRGELTYEGDRAYLSSVPAIDAKHPDEPLALCFSRKITKITLSRIRAVCSYIGVAKDPTTYILEGIGALNREPIDTHPDFVSKIGGTLGHEKNSAKFDAETGQFICFPADAPNDLGGVESYLAVSVNVRRTFWTYKVPDPREMGTIFGKPGDIALPKNVKDLLWGPQTYRQVGRLYQMSEELLGSGPRGWNTKIYKG